MKMNVDQTLDTASDSPTLYLDVQMFTLNLLYYVWIKMTPLRDPWIKGKTNYIFDNRLPLIRGIIWKDNWKNGRLCFSLDSHSLWELHLWFRRSVTIKWNRILKIGLLWVHHNVKSCPLTEVKNDISTSLYYISLYLGWEIWWSTQKYK